MSYFFSTQPHTTLGKRFVVTLLLCAFILAPISSTFQPKQAEAQWSVFDPANWTINGITAGATAAAAETNFSIFIKEFSLDTIAFMLINLMLQEMSRSIVTWINSGFEGKPAFVTDLGAFLTDIADKTAGQYIWGSKLGSLCSPFRLDVRMALDIQYRKSRDFKIDCTVSDIVDNVEGFANSANPVNNWDSWYEVSLRPENNVYGAYLLAQNELGNELAEAEKQGTKRLDFGKGFLSKEKCEKVEGIEKCSIVTPGTTIEAQLNNTLDSGRQRIQVADEFNEIVSALFAQLATQAFTGVGGLLGLTQSGSGGGSGTYYDTIAASGVGSETSTNPIEASARVEGEWRTLHRQRVALIDATEDYLDDSCMSGSVFPNDLKEMRATSLFEIANADFTISALNDLTRELAQAKGRPDSASTTAAIMREYLDMQSGGKIHTTVDVQMFPVTTLRETGDAVTSYKSRIDQSCRVNSDLQGAGN